MPDYHEAAASEPFTRAVCGHVYDAAAEGGGVAFADLPDSWKCPICGAAKSAYAGKCGKLKFINHRPVYEAVVAGRASSYLYYADASENDDALRRVGRKVFCKVLEQFWGNDAASEVKRWFMQDGPHGSAKTAGENASKYTPISLRQWMEETQLQLEMELTKGERGTLMQRRASAAENSDKDVQLALKTKRLQALKKRMEKSNADMELFNEFAKKAVFQLHTKRDVGPDRKDARLGKDELEKAIRQIYGDKTFEAEKELWCETIRRLEESNGCVNEKAFLEKICKKYDERK